MERSRRSVLLSVPPLWLIGVCLFLPTVRSCERMESPAMLVRGGPLFFSGFCSPYLFAELLAVLAIVALAGQRVTPRLQRATLAAVVLSSASAVILAAMGMRAVVSAGERVWSLFAAGCVIAAFTTLWRARRDDQWSRFAASLRAYVVLALPMTTHLARIGIEDGAHRLGWGAYVYFVAAAALCVIHVRRLVRSSPG